MKKIDGSGHGVQMKNTLFLVVGTGVVLWGMFKILDIFLCCLTTAAVMNWVPFSP